MVLNYSYCLVLRKACYDHVTIHIGNFDYSLKNFEITKNPLFHPLQEREVIDSLLKSPQSNGFCVRFAADYNFIFQKNIGNIGCFNVFFLHKKL
jgi:hypothetical protein